MIYGLENLLNSISISIRDVSFEMSTNRFWNTVMFMVYFCLNSINRIKFHAFFTHFGSLYLIVVRVKKGVSNCCRSLTVKKKKNLTHNSFEFWTPFCCWNSMANERIQRSKEIITIVERTTCHFAHTVDRPNDRPGNSYLGASSYCFDP